MTKSKEFFFLQKYMYLHIHILTGIHWTLWFTCSHDCTNPITVNAFVWHYKILHGWHSSLKIWFNMDFISQKYTISSGLCSMRKIFHWKNSSVLHHTSVEVNTLTKISETYIFSCMNMFIGSISRYYRDLT